MLRSPHLMRSIMVSILDSAALDSSNFPGFRMRRGPKDL